MLSEKRDTSLASLARANLKIGGSQSNSSSGWMAGSLRHSRTFHILYLSSSRLPTVLSPDRCRGDNYPRPHCQLPGANTIPTSSGPPDPSQAQVHGNHDPHYRRHLHATPPHSRSCQTVSRLPEMGSGLGCGTRRTGPTQ